MLSFRSIPLETLRFIKLVIMELLCTSAFVVICFFPLKNKGACIKCIIFKFKNVLLSLQLLQK